MYVFITEHNITICSKYFAMKCCHINSSFNTEIIMSFKYCFFVTMSYIKELYCEYYTLYYDLCLCWVQLPLQLAYTHLSTRKHWAQKMANILFHLTNLLWPFLPKCNRISTNSAHVIFDILSFTVLHYITNHVIWLKLLCLIMFQTLSLVNFQLSTPQH
jgi:RNAse (barnase) inhibitor barstar